MVQKHHDNLLPNEVLVLSNNFPNTIICHSCANDMKSNGITIGRSFTNYNGVGPIIRYDAHPYICTQHRHTYMYTLISIRATTYTS